ncbi:hypothetical protein C8R44DRAFT_741656 [Mycena epipterygia]|nr:hypothetical protein C8R44DRAFT_741656 [Mycena epipterygia]
MLTPSAIIALTLITASAPGISAPVPAARELPTTNGVAARSSASLLEGFLGQGFESVGADFLGGGSSATTSTDPRTGIAGDVIGTVGGGIESILSKLFRYAVASLRRGVLINT